MKLSLSLLRLCAAILFLIPATSLTAQERQNVDKILAIVGRNRIILKSEFEQMVSQTSQQNPGMVMNDSTRCLILQELITGKMLVEQAERDSLLVSDDEVDGQLENRIRYFVRQYGSKDALEKGAGKTVYQMKEDNRDIVKEQMMADKVKGKLLQNVHVTPAEVQAFYNKIPKDSLPFYPATIEVGQIVLEPADNPELDKYAYDKLAGIRKEIVTDGKSFETQAIFNSEDPGSRDNGGLYKDVTRDGGFDPAFVQAAFRLQNGEVSPIVKTKFGYHIIQMVQRKGDQVDIRHILIIPQHVASDYKASLERLDSIRAQVIAGKLTFGAAVGKYSADEQSKMTGGMIADPRTGATQLEVDQLDPQLALMLDSLKPGVVSQPQQFKNERGEVKTRIVYLKGRTEPHKANLRDDYGKIQAVARGQKEADKLEEWIAERLPTYYMRIDPDYTTCGTLQKWSAKTAGR